MPCRSIRVQVPVIISVNALPIITFSPLSFCCPRTVDLSEAFINYLKRNISSGEADGNWQWMMELWNRIFDVPSFFESCYRFFESLEKLWDLQNPDPDAPLSKLAKFLSLNLTGLPFKDEIINFCTRKG